MASGARMGDSNGALVTCSLRVSKIEFKGLDHTPILRIGWLNNEFSVFTHWKRVDGRRRKDGTMLNTVGWKTSLTKWIPTTSRTLTLVLFQKVGGTESPVGYRTIPCEQIFDTSTQKHKFYDLPFAEMKASVVGTMSGWVRVESKEPTQDSSEKNWQSGVCSPDYGETISTASSTTPNSVDMSIDLTLEMPKEFYVLISEREVFANVLEKHKDLLKKNEFILNTIIDADPRLFNGIPIPKSFPNALFMELGMLVDNPSQDGSFLWAMGSRMDFNALMSAAEGMHNALKTYTPQSHVVDFFQVTHE